MDQKKIIIMLVDSLMLEPLKKALKEQKCPAFQFFVDHGTVSELVSPFPTMSVNVESSLLSGHYPDVHHLPGLVWFNEKENRLINYGTNGRELFQLGFFRSLNDWFYHLNFEHLSKQVTTIYEELKIIGKHSASINGLVYRGTEEQNLNIPRLLSFFSSFPRNMLVKGPDLLTYGSFQKQKPSKQYGRFWQKFGFNNRFSVQELMHLINHQLLPPLTIVYFPDMDQIIHKKGVEDTTGIEKMDRELQNVLNCFSSWEKAIANNIWIILGDNGQAFIHNDKKTAVIALEQLLKPYRIAKLSKGVRENDDLVAAVNQRMAYIYSLKPDRQLEEIANKLKKDKRIDVIAWLEKDQVQVVSGRKEGKITFWKENRRKDIYGNNWAIEGDYHLLDLKIENEWITYGEYPDALARLYAAVSSHHGKYLAVSAYPGYEFRYGSSPVHVGGASHGGLHKDDSLVAFIVSGTKTLPQHNRIIDIKKWILTFFT